MGLDITAYDKIQFVDCVYDEYGEPIDLDTREELEDGFIAIVNTNFPKRAEDIKDHKFYRYENKYSFRAGSYGGYNNWRNQLAKLAGYPLTKYKDYFGFEKEGYDAGAWEVDGGPFWELINFSDCEGIIGTEVSKKLAKDFADYQEKVDLLDDEYFQHSYKNWREAFELASDDGAVSFH